MDQETATLLTRGSMWRRWDPHIHTPGTIHSDGFGVDAWDPYLTRIEEAEPAVEALGITDYWSLDRYEEVRAHRNSGRLRNVALIFPNVEMRLGIGTQGGRAINVHLLISPDDREHLERARAFLRSITFRAFNETFACAREDLIRLGRRYKPETSSDDHAHKLGAEQFKVTSEELHKALNDSEWARNNVLIAVAAGSNDGASGLANDSSMTTVRNEIQRAAHVIFSGNPNDRTFWLGEGSDSLEALTQRYGGAKPCLHGSDAHDLARVCVPDQQRLTWIKGDSTFESLRQACIEPGSRAFVGSAPPNGALPYRVIDSIALDDSTWFASHRIALNPGLVGIIGERGAGKTALADIIAAAGGSREGHDNPRSFLCRARKHLSNQMATLTWRDGTSTSATLDGQQQTGSDPRVQYLSQQFVERLCSSDGRVTDELLAEIERVVFNEHDADSRAGAANFGELLDMRADAIRRLRSATEETLRRTVSEPIAEKRKHHELPALNEQRAAATQSLTDDRAARQSLTGGSSQSDATRLDHIQSAIDTRQHAIDAKASQLLAIARLRDSVDDARNRLAQNELRDLERDHADAGLARDDWPHFARVFAGDVDAVLDRLTTEARQSQSSLVGAHVDDRADDKAYIEHDANLASVPLQALKKEAVRLKDLIGLDAHRQTQLAELDGKIARGESFLSKLAAQVADAQKAAQRIPELESQRADRYREAFEALAAEERELSALYAPLANKLQQATGALGQLTFAVRRQVDVDRWAERGEALLDLRASGAFRGRGSLLRVVKERGLCTTWRSGSSAEIATTVATFRDSYRADLEGAKMANAGATATDLEDWLNSTDHVTISYGVQYGGVDVEQLSPGTRGIVLLLLYLSLDRNDDRPLIIDQPEENLDPSSVSTDLVDRFREVSLRRQVIIVTHNANLIVNTDADQVIVASSGSHDPRELPQITYAAGGLEDPNIRHHICEILEGGADAFKRRARRLHLDLAR